MWRGNRQGSPLRVERSGSPARRRPKVGKIGTISPTFAQLGVNGRREPDFFAKLEAAAKGGGLVTAGGGRG